VSDQEPPEDRPEAASQPPEPPSIPLSQKLGRVLIGVLVVLFGVFAVANAQPVDFSWIFGETQVEIDPTGERVAGGVPLIALLVAAFVIGLLLGLVLAWQGRRSRRRAERRGDR
jgi:uncharacterized integral membrane protein